MKNLSLRQSVSKIILNPMYMARLEVKELADMRALEELAHRLSMKTGATPKHGTSKMRGGAAAPQRVVGGARAATLLPSARPAVKAMADVRALEEEAERANPIRGGYVGSMGLSQFKGGRKSVPMRRTLSKRIDADIAATPSIHNTLEMMESDMPSGEYGYAGMAGGINTGAYEGEGKLHILHESDSDSDMEGAGVISSLGIPVISDLAGMFGLGKRPTKKKLLGLLQRIKDSDPKNAAKAEELMMKLQTSQRMKGSGILDTIMSFLSSLFGSKKKEEPKAAPKSQEYDSSAPASSAVERAKAELASMGIKSLSDFKKWSLRNHPDKGGDTAAYGRVSGLASTAFKGMGKMRGGSARGEIVKRVMKERGCGLGEASRIVKSEGLY